MQQKPKLAQRVAEKIEREILAGGMPPGQRLGRESDLIERFGVSRAVLREALRLVERHGLVRSKRGAGGGVIVAQLAEDAVADVLRVCLEQIDLSDPQFWMAPIEEREGAFATLRESGGIHFHQEFEPPPEMPIPRGPGYWSLTLSRSFGRFGSFGKGQMAGAGPVRIKRG